MDVVADLPSILGLLPRLPRYALVHLQLLDGLLKSFEALGHWAAPRQARAPPQACVWTAGAASACPGPRATRQSVHALFFYTAPAASAAANHTAALLYGACSLCRGQPHRRYRRAYLAVDANACPHIVRTTHTSPLMPIRVPHTDIWAVTRKRTPRGQQEDAVDDISRRTPTHHKHTPRTHRRQTYTCSPAWTRTCVYNNLVQPFFDEGGGIEEACCVHMCPRYY